MPGIISELGTLHLTPDIVSLCENMPSQRTLEPRHTFILIIVNGHSWLTETPAFK